MSQLDKFNTIFDIYIQQIIEQFAIEPEQIEDCRKKMNAIRSRLPFNSLFNSTTTSPSTITKKGKAKDPSSPTRESKISGYNLFCGSVALLFAQRKAEFTLKLIAIIWKNINADIKQAFNEKAVEINSIDVEHRLEQKKIIVREMCETYLQNIVIPVLEYSRDYNSYRKIRKIMKLKNITMSEKLNDLWKIIKADKAQLDNFFDTYEHLLLDELKKNQPAPTDVELYEGEGEGEGEGEEVKTVTTNTNFLLDDEDYPLCV